MTQSFRRSCLCIMLGCLVVRAHALPSQTNPGTLTFQGINISGAARIERASGIEPRLAIFARVRNVTDTTAVIESEESNCEPSFELLHVASGRHFVWSQLSWTQRDDIRSRNSLYDVACVGTGLIVTLVPHGRGELARQTYSVSMIRGDSMPAGAYRIRVPILVYTIVNGFSHVDTLRVWTPRIRVP